MASITCEKIVLLRGGQFEPAKGGQFQPILGGQFKTIWGGQFQPTLGGQFGRHLQSVSGMFEIFLIFLSHKVLFLRLYYPLIAELQVQ
jgi:hypothetical protein